jgi:hypothetical protein
MMIGAGLEFFLLYVFFGISSYTLQEERGEQKRGKEGFDDTS